MIKLSELQVAKRINAKNGHSTRSFKSLKDRRVTSSEKRKNMAIKKKTVKAASKKPKTNPVKKAAKKTSRKASFRVTPKLRDQVITDVAGQDSLDVVEYLRGKENISEFIIARELEQEINAIRNKLYRLLQSNLVRFNRKKDKQKGWYIYYWTLNLNQVKYIHLNLKKKRLDGLQERLKREQSHFFFACSDRCIRLDFEQAISFEYKCPECGELLHQEDNAAIISQIQQEIEQLTAEISDIEQSI